MNVQKKRNVRYAVPENSAQQERYVSSVTNSCSPRNFFMNSYWFEPRCFGGSFNWITTVFLINQSQ